MTEEKKKISWGGILYILSGAVIGGVIGFTLSEKGIDFDFAHVLMMFVSIIVGSYLHILFHEGGHMICGLMTGYRFLSFRVANFM